MILRLDELPAAEDASFGGKARGLARLVRAGLPVPPGFAISAGAFPLDDATRDRLWLEARRLTEPLVVRSSATVEDSLHAAAPGVFASVGGLTRARLMEAIDTVRASLTGEAAHAYLEARGLGGADMAVVVQNQVKAVAHGTMYSRAPGEEARIRIEADGERGGTSAELARGEDPAAAAATLGIPAGIVAELVAHADRGEALLGGAPADLEWVWDGEQLWLVQLRPAAGASPGARPRARADFALAEPGTWTWDASHNPFPLSPAQEGLVLLVDRRGLAAYRQRVIHGHLYASAATIHAEPLEASTLRRLYDDEHVPILQAAAARLAEARDLDHALEAYCTLYEVYASRLAPVLSATRGALLEAVAAERGYAEAERACERLTSAPSVLSMLLHAVRARTITEDALRAEAAPFAPEWDVACPTFGEDPAPLVAALRAPLRPNRAVHRDHDLPASLRTSRMRTLVAAAREAARIGEDDDVWFARAQAGVRRVLLGIGRRHRIDDDIFWLSLDEVRAGRLDDAAARAAVARTRDATRRTLRVPLRIVDGAPQYASPGGDGVLRGRGTGGRARGTVVRDPADVTRTPDAILVVEALLPSHAPAVLGAHAVVAEHGGLLGHGAALAREQGIPCVVGAPGAADLAPGIPVLVDGDAGLVVSLRA